MGMEVERLPGEPIIIGRLLPPMNAAVDAKAVREESVRLSEDIVGTVYRIIDLTQVELSLFDIMNGLSYDIAASPENHHFIMVGDQEMVRLTAEAAAQEQYGHRQVLAFTSVDAAIRHVRETMTQG
ncbi:MAG: hypothetical protein GYB68_12325 [Chloroflexi bacterium]|nr:hypothetical protein [Chloroflexota bacterium]